MTLVYTVYTIIPTINFRMLSLLPKETLHSLAVNLQSFIAPKLPGPYVVNNLLFVCMNLPVQDISYRWLFSLSIVFSRFIPVVAHLPILFLVPNNILL